MAMTSQQDKMRRTVSGLLRTLVAIGSAIALVLLYALLRVAWFTAGQRVNAVSDLVGQTGVLLGSGQLVLAVVVAAATVYYAKQTRDMVVEMKTTRVHDIERSQRDSVLARNRQVRVEVGQLLVAMNRALSRVPMVRTAVSRRWRWFFNDAAAYRAVEALQDHIAEVAAAKNMLSSIDVTAENVAGEVLDELLRLVDLAVEPASSEAEIDRSLRSLRALREQLEAHLTAMVDTAGV